MEDSSLKLNLREIKSDLIQGIRECSQRGLLHSTKWLAELNFSIKNVKLQPSEIPEVISEDFDTEYEVYTMSKAFFDNKEYDRCAYFTKECVTARAKFLHLYSTYLSIEKKKLDNTTDTTCPTDPTKNNSLKTLLTTLKNERLSKQLDGYGLYLYGVVLKKLDLTPLAIEIFVEAIHAAPLHWGAWLELAPLILNREKFNSINLPDHWMKHFFTAYAYLEQLCNDEALEIYQSLLYSGFENSKYLIAQIAIAHHNRRELDQAIESFKHLEKIDPYRLDNLDTYSNLLYVKDMKIELANLAHHAVSIDKYKVETCCVIGNYYSLRSDHTKAVLYFQRALKLNPNYLSAWTLMGHEYVEMKNTNAAIQSYRQAIEVNKRDFRAWYGLGQTYEILKLPFYSLYYYKQAQQLRQNDSRMLIALGETYEKLDKIENALKCYHKACNVGDIEGFALIKLARLYDNFNDVENAAAAYTEYCLTEQPKATLFGSDQADLYTAYRYLANYYVKKEQLDDAYTYACKCLEYEETKEEGKALLRTIASKRSQQEPSDISMDVVEETSLSLPPQSTNILDENAFSSNINDT